MNEEIIILEKMLPQMAGVMNVVPGETVQMKEGDTLLILQRRMLVCDLQKELTTYVEIFAEKDGVSIKKLEAVTIAYIRIKLLVERKELNFNPRSYRELIKKFKVQVKKVNNIIHLTQVNSMTADDYQKEKIELTLKKNKTFLEGFISEIDQLEKKIERMPVIDDEKLEESHSKPFSQHAKQKTDEIASKKYKFGISTAIDKLSKRIGESKEKKFVDERLKNVEKEQSTTKCVEIPFYDKSLAFTEVICCKDLPAYSLFKRKNNIYFGLTRNIGKNVYDNRDQSLIELTEATEDFLQFMSADLLSEEYVLQPFSDKEKEGLKMYFDFLSGCFQKHIGVTLTVQEYIKFKAYYNRLVMKMFELEKKGKEDYYRSLILADTYICYMESYDLECEDDEETVIANIIHEKNRGYIDTEAKDKLQVLKEKILDFNKVEKSIEDDSDKKELVVHPEVLPQMMPYEGMGLSPQAYGMPVFPIGMNQGVMQIVIQILNQDREIVDEALYAGNNINQALYDYATKDAYIKKLGFRSNGTDVFYKEEVK
jgi:hypothetical protein